jgi:hypothetical protein
MRTIEMSVPLCVQALAAVLAPTAAMLAAAGLAAGAALADGDAKPPRIAPIASKPGGQSYGRWAAQWWQWALGVPAATTVFDQSGENCAERQVDDTWFLAGSFGPEPVVRSCTIPAGKALFFPLVNYGSFAFLTDPPAARTEAFLRQQATCQLPVELFAEIDGFRIARLKRYFTGRRGSQSPIFTVQLPPGNILGAGDGDIPELVLSPSAEQGFYLFVKPLPPGEHVVHWEARGCSETAQDITYHLTIEPAADDDG